MGFFEAIKAVTYRTYLFPANAFWSEARRFSPPAVIHKMREGYLAGRNRIIDETGDWSSEEEAAKVEHVLRIVEIKRTYL